jgi:hypothetical protein
MMIPARSVVSPSISKLPAIKNTVGLSLASPPLNAYTLRLSKDIAFSLAKPSGVVWKPKLSQGLRSII